MQSPLVSGERGRVRSRPCGCDCPAVGDVRKCAMHAWPHQPHSAPSSPAGKAWASAGNRGCCAWAGLCARPCRRSRRPGGPVLSSRRSARGWTFSAPYPPPSPHQTDPTLASLPSLLTWSGDLGGRAVSWEVHGVGELRSCPSSVVNMLCGLRQVTSPPDLSSLINKWRDACLCP